MKTTSSKLFKCFLLLVLFNAMLPAVPLSAQQITQTLRGKVVDQELQTSLPGVNVIILHSSPLQGASTDLNGEFIIPNVPLGRVDLLITMLGYEQMLMPNVLIGSGKEVVLFIALSEAITQLEAAEIQAYENQHGGLNEMALVGVHKVTVEDTKRFAGAIDDPARMVSAFAGVSGDASGNNDIVVRGNSPTGLQWRLEGVQIPNPNHFADEGSTGGPINVLNSNMLANSDFFTGAFAPEYGNATSGIMDMRLRTGNNKQREYTAGVSVLGMELGAEGPFKTGGEASYLFNYRYSTLSLLDKFQIVDYQGVPKYQDASFKCVFPLNDRQLISVFGLGGMSQISQESYSDELSQEVSFKERMDGHMGVLGLKYLHELGTKDLLESTLTISNSGSATSGEEWLHDEEFQTIWNDRFEKNSLQLNTLLRHKFNAKHSLKTGLVAQRMAFKLFSEYRDSNYTALVRELDSKGHADLLQAHAGWKYRINNKLTMMSGVHLLFFGQNHQISVEPRVSFEQVLNRQQVIHAGFGVHSKLESIATYFAEYQDEAGDVSMPNQNLGLSKSLHLTAGHSWRFADHWQLQSDAYYQHPYQVPIAADPTLPYSTLNMEGWFSNMPLNNEGRGRNYGLEFSLERFFYQQYYLMSTVSLYRAEYALQDGVYRRGKFDGNYIVNLLGGKEFPVGNAEKNKRLIVNTKFALTGGRRFTPVDLEASLEAGHQVMSSSEYSAKGEAIFKCDLSLTLRREKENKTTELKLDVQNVTNNQAVIQEYFVPEISGMAQIYQLAILPVLSYKIYF